MLDAVEVQCPWCGESLELSADRSGGTTQSYVEDCAVCCRPFTVRLRFDESGSPWAEVGQE